MIALEEIHLPGRTWSPAEVALTLGPAVPAIAEGGMLPHRERRRGIA
jgi:hypothetical protein